MPLHGLRAGVRKTGTVSMAEATILVVEDENDIRDLLVFTLVREGFAVLQADSGPAALAQARSRHPDLILLDLMLPGMDGLNVYKHLQREPGASGIPVIMLTAKGEEIDRIVGLEIGAADYVVKPFSPREVILRIRAVLGRKVKQSRSSILHCDPVSLDSSSHSVRVSGNPVELTITEFRLLQELIEHPGKVRTREQILSAVWGHSFDGYSRTVDSHVRRLRAKLGQGAQIIETIRGVGYRAKGSAP